MKNKDDYNEQSEESKIAFSLKLDLISSFLGLISEALEIWALIEAIDEDEIAEKEEKKAQNKIDLQLNNMQSQIDKLTIELAHLTQNQSNK